MAHVLGGLSYSSISKYAECGERWRLSYLHHLDKQSWWVTAMGTAVHYITEQYDLARLGRAIEPEAASAEAFGMVFTREVERLEGLGVELNASGRVLRQVGKSGGPNKKDEAWCRLMGPRMVEAWINWRRGTNFEVAFMPDGEPGVEYEVNGLVGGVPFRGFIDRVFLDHKGRHVVVDIKTGANPGSDVQLRAYAAVLRKQGVDVDRGCFWMAADGEPAEWVGLDADRDAGFERQVEMAAKGIQAGVFAAHVSGFCRSCPVRDYCSAFGGEKAELVGGVELPVVFASRETVGEVA